MFKTSWQSVMDPNLNALKGLPKPVKFQLMVTLALMWSSIFCTSVGILNWLPGYVFAHVGLILVGLFGTTWIFKLADKKAQPVPAVLPRTDRNPDRA